MKHLTAMIASIAVAMPAFIAGSLISPSVAQAQSNDNYSTPLNSRIRRSRPLPLEPKSIWQPRQLSDAQKSRSRSQIGQLSRCLWDRSNEDGLDLLNRTDFGFTQFTQIGIENDEIADHYAISTCLGRIVRNANSGLMLRYDAPSMRSWYLQAAYFDRYEDGPSWIRPGYVVDERTYPLSENNVAVKVAMDFADCVVAQDPNGADYFFRTSAGSPEEMAALRSLVPALSPCLPDGQQMEIDPVAMRAWLGEGLWHASNNLVPAPTENSESDQ